MQAASSTPTPERVAILPLRNSVLFPMSVVPINVGRPRSVRLVEELEVEESLIGVVAQRDSSVLAPSFDDLFTVGTLARVVKVIRINETSYSVVLNGVGRFVISEALGLEPYMRARIIRQADPKPNAEQEVETLADELREKTRRAIELMPELPKETAGILDNVGDPGSLADLISANFPDELASVPVRQKVLEAFDHPTRLELVSKMLDRQLEGLQIKAEITNLVETEMTRNQRAYVLRQQLKAIREELGESPDEDDEVEQLRERLALAEVPEEVRKAANKQLGRLAAMQSQSAEYQVARSYVEWIVDLPWSQSSTDNLDVSEVKRCLDQDHFGLETVKKRIIEFAAVRKLRKDNRSPILLFVGPPGVGKTSLGRSIARAMGRRYERIALGGVRDEAEIRGHRRTYVGALPGRILAALKKAGTNNPVLVLDEIDKLGQDMRGDPASALLEVLDPAQNNTFTDHYLDLPFDLSKVTFLATANYRGSIPDALADRLEIIEVPGYTHEEKLKIAERFLIPKQMEDHGLKSSMVHFDQDCVRTLIESYTREAGVRGLERTIAAMCREMAVKRAEGVTLQGVKLDAEAVQSALGPAKFQLELAEADLAPGLCSSLGVGAAGGELLLCEVSKMPGKGKVHVTGSLGPVLKEAAATAVSYVRSKAARLSLADDWIRDTDIHLHIPRARVARDFAGMGAAIFCALGSLLLSARCSAHIAVVGELTLRGNILPVRGIKAMLLCAHRAKIRTVILPQRNEPDVAEVPQAILAELQIRYIKSVSELLPLVLSDPDQEASPSAGPPAHAPL